MFKKLVSLAVLSSIVVGSWVYASESEATNENKVLSPLAQKLSKTVGLNVQKVQPSPIEGLVELVTEQGLFYATPDGNFLMQGRLYGLGDNNVVNHTEETLAQVRVEGMEKFKNDMIVYPAKDEKHVVTVFTDITCGYCRQMHAQMSEYNDLGITVRYLAYPRAGVKDQMGQYSQGFNDLRSIWCHEKPNEALTKAKLGSSVAKRICEKPVEDEFNFGRQVGVTGTPAIIFENGFMLPGYKDPKSLIEIINSVKSAS